MAEVVEIRAAQEAISMDEETTAKNPMERDPEGMTRKCETDTEDSKSDVSTFLWDTDLRI
jgi:hypothetical protein